MGQHFVHKQNSCWVFGENVKERGNLEDPCTNGRTRLNTHLTKAGCESMDLGTLLCIISYLKVKSMSTLCRHTGRGQVHFHSFNISEPDEWVKLML